jgi:hypothetical protein
LDILASSSICRRMIDEVLFSKFLACNKSKTLGYLSLDISTSSSICPTTGDKVKTTVDEIRTTEDEVGIAEDEVGTAEDDVGTTEDEVETTADVVGTAVYEILLVVPLLKT